MNAVFNSGIATCYRYVRFPAIPAILQFQTQIQEGILPKHILILHTHSLKPVWFYSKVIFISQLSTLIDLTTFDKINQVKKS